MSCLAQTLESSPSVASSNSRNVSNNCSILELLLIGAAGGTSRAWPSEPGGMSLTPPPPPPSSVIITGIGDFTLSSGELLLPWVTEKGGGGGGGRLLLDWGLGIPFSGTCGDSLAIAGSGGLMGATFFPGSAAPLPPSSSEGCEVKGGLPDSMGDLFSPSIPWSPGSASHDPWVLRFRRSFTTFFNLPSLEDSAGGSTGSLVLLSMPPPLPFCAAAIFGLNWGELSSTCSLALLSSTSLGVWEVSLGRGSALLFDGGLLLPP